MLVNYSNETSTDIPYWKFSTRRLNSFTITLIIILSGVQKRMIEKGLLITSESHDTLLFENLPTFLFYVIFLFFKFFFVCFMIAENFLVLHKEKYC